jgi:hypothetical protein
MGILFVLLFWGVVGVVVASVSGLLAKGVTSALTRDQAAGTPSANERTNGSLCVSLSVYLSRLGRSRLYFPRSREHCSSPPRSRAGKLILLPSTERILAPDDRCERSRDSLSIDSEPRESRGDYDDAISGVRELQIAGPYIFGGFDKDYSKHFGESSPVANRFFMLDTRSGDRTNFDGVGEDLLGMGDAARAIH